MTKLHTWIYVCMQLNEHGINIGGCILGCEYELPR